MTKRKPWTKSFGERRSGVRVRVYEARPGGTLMRSVWNASTGKEDRKSLGHKDKALAERQAYELLAQLVADEEAVEKGTLTLAQLQRLYLESPAFAEKKERTQQEDARRMERVVRFLGPSREVQTLTDSDVRRFIAARRKGDPKLLGVKPGVAVRDRSLEADLVAIHTMLNWVRESSAGNEHPTREEPDSTRRHARRVRGAVRRCRTGESASPAGHPACRGDGAKVVSHPPASMGRHRP
jgi:hypothetical protein